ncbi:GntR family transcriptional regulator [Leifsonia sp. YAF41]|uniref:GntR family transcriptional regulator n=1 Tax=Leifsonia sp. YAF41 TaxID=3233086 RepID=UPI003F946563
MAAPHLLPLYAQISRHVRSLILDGDLHDGDVIPSEPTLMEQFDTTRGTVRQAIGQLVTEGLVERVQGKGTYVRFRPMTHSLWNFGGFSDSVKGRSGDPVSRVVEHEVYEQNGERFLRLVRLRGVNVAGEQKIFSLDTSHLPLAYFPGMDTVDFENASLYDTMRSRYEVYPRRTEVALSTVIPDETARELLGEAAGSHALVRLRGHAFDADDRQIEQIEIVYASSVEFNISTTIPDPRLSSS